jgi:hypothetical protein
MGGGLAARAPSSERARAMATPMAMTSTAAAPRCQRWRPEGGGGGGVGSGEGDVLVAVEEALEVALELGHVLVAAVAVLLEGAHHHGLHGDGDAELGAELGGRLGLSR